MNSMDYGPHTWQNLPLTRFILPKKPLKMTMMTVRILKNRYMHATTESLKIENGLYTTNTLRNHTFFKVKVRTTI